MKHLSLALIAATTALSACATTTPPPVQYVNGKCVDPSSVTPINANPGKEAFDKRSEQRIAKSKAEGKIIWSLRDQVKKIPPIMPTKADRSGYCFIEYDVNQETGTTENVEALYCTQDIYASSAITSVSKWQFNLSKSDMARLTTTDALTKVSFRLVDRCGKIIPEAQ